MDESYEVRYVKKGLALSVLALVLGLIAAASIPAYYLISLPTDVWTGIVTVYSVVFLLVSLAGIIIALINIRRRRRLYGMAIAGIIASLAGFGFHGYLLLFMFFMGYA